MIHSCDEVQLDERITDRREFLVTTDEHDTPESILRLCGKIPKIRSRHTFPYGKPIQLPNENMKEGESEVYEVNVHIRSARRGLWLVKCLYRPVEIAVAEESDEPKFPPYSGPIGKQPDGSFVLSPRLFYYLREAWLHRGRDKMIKVPHDYFDEFCKVLDEETGYGGEQYT